MLTEITYRRSQSASNGRFSWGEHAYSILSQYQAILDLATYVSLNKLFVFARRRPMRRYTVRGTALLVVLTVLVLPLLATAQRPLQVRRIAFLGFGPLPS